MVKRGKLSPASAAKIRAKANRKLGPGGVDQDINAPGNRAPSPAQDDQNNWKSKPVSRGAKVKTDSQGSGEAARSAKGRDYSGQAKHGGTEAAGANKKGQAKVSSGTQVTSSRDLKKEMKKVGTGKTQPAPHGKSYANGSSSMDSMKSVIRDH
jgi:hypothetical protein